MLGALVNHELNRVFIFTLTDRSRLNTLFRFLIIAVLGFMLNFCIMILMVNFTEIYYLLCQIAATLVVVILTFTLNKFWTFQA